MGQEKEEALLREEAAQRRQRAEGNVCYICGAPATARDPQTRGRLCGYHLHVMEKDD